jgi:hypothetical protein
LTAFSGGNGSSESRQPRQPVLPYELPDIFSADEFGRAWRQVQERDVAGTLMVLAPTPGIPEAKKPRQLPIAMARRRCGRSQGCVSARGGIECLMVLCYLRPRKSRVFSLGDRSEGRAARWPSKPRSLHRAAGFFRLPPVLFVRPRGPYAAGWSLNGAAVMVGSSGKVALITGATGQDGAYLR